MTNSSIALLIANNGLGHARRALSILKRLLAIASPLDVTVVASEQTLERLIRLNQITEFHSVLRNSVHLVQGGVTWPVPKDLLKRSREWLEDVSQLGQVWNADLVISDNYSEVLTIRADAVLMGSFLWSDVLAPSPLPDAAELAAQERELLATHRPPMLCVEELATPGVLAYTQAVGLPYMCAPLQAGRSGRGGGRRRGIGLTVGTTSAAAKLAEAYIPALARLYPVYIDRALAGALPADVAARATVTSMSSLVRQVEVLVCRPGMGAISDAVGACVPLVVFAERGQAEMSHLVERLPAIGLAVGAGIEPSAAKLLDAVRRVKAEPTYSQIRDRLVGCQRGGTEAAAQWCAAELRRRCVSL
jgi:hypothetical protein